MEKDAKKKLELLKSNYTRQLVTYQRQLKKLQLEVPNNPDIVTDIILLAHRLSGSGKAYGFAQISRSARTLEITAENLKEKPLAEIASTLKKPLAELVDCLAQVVNKNGSPIKPHVNALPVTPTQHNHIAVNLLLVDDDPEFTSFLSNQLAQHGYNVQCLSDITLLTQTIKRYTPLAILVDMDFYGDRMAGANEVALWRESDGNPLPVVFISAFDIFEVRLAAVEAGGNHFLKKPVDQTRLLSILRAELDLIPDDPFRVLLVDDDHDLLNLYETVLTQAGYKVFIAHNAKKAIDVIEQANPELILIDVYMPDCGGIELGKLVRQHEDFARIPLLFMSAAADTDVQLACARLANDEFINKPIEPWRLLMVIKSRAARGRRIRHNTMVSDNQHLLNDKLTALPMLDALSRRIATIAEKPGQTLHTALIKIDIRDFHTVNNVYGPLIGDEVLQKVAWSLSQCLNTKDSIYRQDGDEFYVLLEDYDSVSSINQQVTKLSQAIDYKSSVQSDLHCSLAADLGVAVNSAQVNSATQLIASVETALFEAKKSVSPEVRYFDSSMQQRVQSRFALAQAIRIGFEEQQFIPLYQPIFAVASNEIVGFEALARWQHPERGLLSPVAFIALMEEQDLITQLTDQILIESLIQISSWQKIRPELFISINLSARDIENPLFLNTLKQLINKYELNPGSITLEITETILLSDWKQASYVVSAIKAMGVKLALDDFGSGYSSLSYLSRVAADKLKIDRSFIQNWSNTGDARLLRTMVNLGHTMNMNVIAEGIEVESELNFIKELQCDDYQGYLPAKPMAAEDIETLYFASPSIKF